MLKHKIALGKTNGYGDDNVVFDETSASDRKKKSINSLKGATQ